MYIVNEVLIVRPNTTLRYNNTNNQLDATIKNSIDNYNQLNMFWAIISPRNM